MHRSVVWPAARRTWQRPQRRRRLCIRVDLKSPGLNRVLPRAGTPQGRLGDPGRSGPDRPWLAAPAILPWRPRPGWPTCQRAARGPSLDLVRRLAWRKWGLGPWPQGPPPDPCIPRCVCHVAPRVVSGPVIGEHMVTLAFPEIRVGEPIRCGFVSIFPLFRTLPVPWSTRYRRAAWPRARSR